MLVKKEKKIGPSPDVDNFLIKLGFFLETQNLNTKILEAILRHLLLIDAGTGYHTIEIVIRNHRVVTIKGADTQLVDEPIKI